MTKRTGFTLVEILIVVIILGILAAIVVPQFTDASEQARMASLQSDLQTVRGQIELYKMQHVGRTPSADAATHTTAFWTQLTTKTDLDGSAGTDFGPYLQQEPTNPFQASSAVSEGGIGAATATDGWNYDGAGTGKFNALGTGGGEDLTGL